MANKLWDEKRRTLLDALKKLRTERVVTQIEMANRLGKPQSYVSKYESGERKLDFIEVIDICEALGVDPKVLLKLFNKS